MTDIDQNITVATVVDAEPASTVVVADDEQAPARRGRRWWRRKPVKRAFVWTHRWSALVLGLALLVVTTTGVPLLYEQEIDHARHADAYRESGPATIELAEALPIVQAHDPKFTPEALFTMEGVYAAENFESGRRVTVDPASEKVLGDFNPTEDTGAVAWTMSLMNSIHVCMLTCPEYVGYQAWLGKTVPGTTWLGFEGEGVSWGGLILGVTGVLLLFLTLSGIWLWWPGIKRWFVGIRVRLRKGRYARDYDLHQVAGMIAVPLLLVWAITGTGYEFGFVEKAWYGVTPGSHVEQTLESTASKQPDIGVPAAVAAARKVGGDGPIPAIDLPPADDAAATYGVWFQDGFDPWRLYDTYPGDRLVSVDRKTGATEITYGVPGQPNAQTLWEDWNFMTHTGWVVGPWWRIVWVVFGLVPLLLAITGLSTWLFKRGLRKRRRRTAATA